MAVVEVLFFASVLLIAYVFVGYPLLAFVLSRLCERPVRRCQITPRVSIIIAAYNEERDLRRKIENTLSLKYPAQKLEIIVASDCSTDRTDEVVRSYADRGVVLCRLPERMGKSVAQNVAVKASSGEILLFSDATTNYQPDAIEKIVRSFADSDVGCVAGQLIYEDETTATGRGCRSYWSYEKFLRDCESRFGSLVGVSGCLYAVRRACYGRIASDMSSDFVIASEIHLQGLRTVYDREAVSTEKTNRRVGDEFRMRVRVIEQTISAMHRYRQVLNPAEHGMYAFQMISHKVLRYSVPLFLIVAFVSNLLLSRESLVFTLLFFCQLAFYVAAIVGWFFERRGLHAGRIVLPYYVVLGNLACVVGFLKFVSGEAHVVWEPLRETGMPEGT